MKDIRCHEWHAQLIYRTRDQLPTNMVRHQNAREPVGLFVVLYSYEMVATIVRATQQRCLNENLDRKIDLAVVMPPF